VASLLDWEQISAPSPLKELQMRTLQIIFKNIESAQNLLLKSQGFIATR
jgi:hypothetical protein